MERLSPAVGERLYSVHEFAKALSLKESTGRAWVLKRKVGYIKLNGRSVRIPEREIAVFSPRGLFPPVRCVDGYPSRSI